MHLPGPLQLTEPRRSFGVVLGAILFATVFQLSAPETDFTRFLTIVIQATVVLLALRAAGSKPRVLKIAAFTMAAVCVISGITLLGTTDVGASGPRLVALVLLLLTPASVIAGVVRELHEDRRVTLQTIYCGLCLYLLLGLAFSFVFAAIDDLAGPFFGAGLPAEADDFLYFSLATLTTTGYGDFSAATELGRAMAVTEALIGQIYLVTVLAVIVSNLGQRRSG